MVFVPRNYFGPSTGGQGASAVTKAFTISPRDLTPSGGVADTFGDTGTLMRTAGDRDRALGTQAKGNKALGPRNFWSRVRGHESFCAQSMSIWLYDAPHTDADIQPVETGVQLIGDHLLEGDLGGL